jgi:hypothetical protein
MYEPLELLFQALVYEAYSLALAPAITKFNPHKHRLPDARQEGVGIL